jgi:hypothetical protein
MMRGILFFSLSLFFLVVVGPVARTLYIQYAWRGGERKERWEIARFPIRTSPRSYGVVPYRVGMYSVHGATGEAREGPREEQHRAPHVCVRGRRPTVQFNARQLTSSPTHARHREEESEAEGKAPLARTRKRDGTVCLSMGP